MMTRCHRPFRQLETLGSGPFLLASGDIGNVANDYTWGLAYESWEWGFPQKSMLVAPTCLGVYCQKSVQGTLTLWWDQLLIQS